ncbi:O-antigen polymerase [Nonlabens antarcticus]|uniref:O-antigen polymerase n=1 Tax=Nonlabens antarcticus TaxID=392714 RepID=UPI0018912993|nr:O-antigen polymerase [Nonlabens antarcticus]
MGFSFTKIQKQITKNKTLFLEILILFFSFMINRNSSNILYNSYHGDGYVDGESFGGWSVFFIVTMAFYIYKTNLENRRHLFFSIAVILYWFLFGNRGEVFPLVFFILLKISKTNLKIKSWKVLLYGSFGVAVFMINGLMRSGTTFNFSTFLGSFFSNFTGTPVTYSLMAVVYHTERVGFAYGITFFEYFLRSLPSFIQSERPGDLSMFLVKEYSTLGGTHFIGEPYFNFGILGVFFFMHSFSSLFLIIEKKARALYEYRYIFIVLIFLGTRTVWYGYITFYKTFLLLSFVLIFLFILKKFRFSLI